VLRILDNGTNLHILPAVFKIFDQKYLPNTKTVLIKPTIMTTCSSKTYLTLSLHINVTIFLCHATAQIKPRPQHFFRFHDHKQLDKHIRYDSSEKMIKPSRRPPFTQHKRWKSMNAVGFNPMNTAFEQTQTYAQWRTERGGLGCSNPPRNSEDIGGILDRMSKKDRRLDFLL